MDADHIGRESRNHLPEPTDRHLSRLVAVQVGSELDWTVSCGL